MSAQGDGDIWADTLGAWRRREQPETTIAERVRRFAGRSPDTTTSGPMRAYVESDILIWQLRGQAKAAELLRRLSAERATELWVGALQRAEVVFFMRPEEEAATRALLSRFKTEAVTQAVVDAASELYREWRRHARGANSGGR